MPNLAIDLLDIPRGSITAPAGCGKTHLISEALRRHVNSKPILVLTHTNAGVMALRERLDRAEVPRDRYRLSTLDGWALRLLNTFPQRAGIDPLILEVRRPRDDYPIIRKAAAILMRDQHINDILLATFERLIVDEYQDCDMLQHAIVAFTSRVLPTVVLGDPMQAIFTFGGTMPDWETQVGRPFPHVAELTTPWRWENAGARALGDWLLEVRKKLRDGHSVDLVTAPVEVSWIALDGTEDRVRQLRAGMTRAVTPNGSVLVIGDGRSPASQRQFASQLPGAMTVESVALDDLVNFAHGLDFAHSDALAKIVEFISKVMTGVGPADFLKRISALERGTARNAPTEAEQAALKFQRERTPQAIIDLSVEISKQGGVRTHRPAVLRACYSALQTCIGQKGESFYDAAIRAREQNRLLGRPLPRRAVGSTLLLKGLEADVAVILNAQDLDAKNLYVAMTRGARKLVICSNSEVLRP